MSSENQQTIQMMQNPEELLQHKIQQQIPMHQQPQLQPQGGLPMMEPAQYRLGEIALQTQQSQGNQQFLQGVSTSSSPTFPVNGEALNQHKQALQEKLTMNASQLNGDITSTSQGAGGILQVQSKAENSSQVLQQQLQQQQSQIQSESQDISDLNDQEMQEDDDENDQDDADDGEGGDDETGKGSGANNKKKYQVISQDVREKFIQKVISKQVTIKEAAKEFGLKFSTSKAILQTFKKEGRIGKKKTRQRKPRLVKKMLLNPDPHNPSQVIQQVFYTTESSMMAAKNQAAAAASANFMNASNVVNASLLNQPHLTQYIIKNHTITNMPVQNYGTANLNAHNNPQSLIEAQYFQQKMFGNQMYPGQQTASQAQQQQQTFNFPQHNNLLNAASLQQQQNGMNSVATLGGQQNAFQASLTPQLAPALGNNDLINNFMLNGNHFSLNGTNVQQTQAQQNQAASSLQQQQQQAQTQNQLHHALLGVANTNASNQIAQQLNYHTNQANQQQAFPLLQQQNIFPPSSPFLSAQTAPTATQQQQQLNQLIGQQTTYCLPINNKGSADLTSFLNFNQFQQPSASVAAIAQNQNSATTQQQQQLNPFITTQGSGQGYDMQIAKPDVTAQPNRASSNGDSANREKVSADGIDTNGSKTTATSNIVKSALLSELAEMSQTFKKQSYTHHFPTTESSQSYQMSLPTTTSTINTTNTSTNSSAHRPSHLQSFQLFNALGGRNESGSFDSINGNGLNLQFLAGQQSFDNNALYQHKLSTDSLNFNIFGNTGGNVPLTFPSIDMSTQLPYLLNNNANATAAANNQIFSSQIHKNSIF